MALFSSDATVSLFEKVGAKDLSSPPPELAGPQTNNVSPAGAASPPNQSSSSLSKENAAVPERQLFPELVPEVPQPAFDQEPSPFSGSTSNSHVTPLALAAAQESDSGPQARRTVTRWCIALVLSTDKLHAALRRLPATELKLWTGSTDAGAVVVLGVTNTSAINKCVADLPVGWQRTYSGILKLLKSLTKDAIDDYGTELNFTHERFGRIDFDPENGRLTIGTTEEYSLNLWIPTIEAPLESLRHDFMMDEFRAQFNAEFFAKTTEHAVRSYFSSVIFSIFRAFDADENRERLLEHACQPFDFRTVHANLQDAESLRDLNRGSHAKFFSFEVTFSGTEQEPNLARFRGTWTVFGCRSFFYLTRRPGPGHSAEEMTFVILINKGCIKAFRDQLLNTSGRMPAQHNSGKFYFVPPSIDHVPSGFSTDHPIWLASKAFSAFSTSKLSGDKRPRPDDSGENGDNSGPRDSGEDGHPPDAQSREDDDNQGSPHKRLRFKGPTESTAPLRADEIQLLTHMRHWPDDEQRIVAVVFDHFESAHGKNVATWLHRRAGMPISRICKLPLFVEDLDAASICESLSMVCALARYRPETLFVLTIAWEFDLDDTDKEMLKAIDHELSALTNLLIYAPAYQPSGSNALVFPQMLSSARFVGAWCAASGKTDPSLLGLQQRIPDPLFRRMEWQPIETAEPHISEAIAVRAGDILQQEPSRPEIYCGQMVRGQLKYHKMTEPADSTATMAEGSVVGVPFGAVHIFVCGENVFAVDLRSPMAEGPVPRQKWIVENPASKALIRVSYSSLTQWKMNSPVLALLVRSQYMMEHPTFQHMRSAADGHLYLFVLRLREWHLRVAETRLIGEALAHHILNAATENLGPSVELCSKVDIDADRGTVLFSLGGEQFFLSRHGRLDSDPASVHTRVIPRWSPAAPSPFEAVVPAARRGQTKVAVLSNSFESGSLGHELVRQLLQETSRIDTVNTAAPEFSLSALAEEWRRDAAANRAERLIVLVLAPVFVDSLPEMDAVAQLAITSNIEVLFPPMDAAQPQWTFPHCVGHQTINRDESFLETATRAIQRAQLPSVSWRSVDLAEESTQPPSKRLRTLLEHERTRDGKIQQDDAPEIEGGSQPSTVAPSNILSFFPVVLNEVFTPAGSALPEAELDHFVELASCMENIPSSTAPSEGQGTTTTPRMDALSRILEVRKSREEYLKTFRFLLRAGGEFAQEVPAGEAGVLLFRKIERLMQEHVIRPWVYAGDWFGHGMYSQLIEPWAGKLEKKLHVCCSEGRLRSIAYLLRQGARVDAKNEQGKTAVDLVRESGNKACIQLMTQHLVRLAFFSQSKPELAFVADQLMKISVNTHDARRNNTTPLIRAAADGNAQLVQQFLEKGADVTLSDADGNTALHYAAAYNHKEITSLLLHAEKSTVAFANKRGMTPFALAVHGGHHDVCELFLTEGAAQAADSSGNTLLHAACFVGDVEVTANLLRWGADKEAKNNCGQTPLDLSSQRNNFGCTEILTQSMNFRDLTATEFAERVSTIKMARFVFISNIKDLQRLPSSDWSSVEALSVFDCPSFDDFEGALQQSPVLAHLIVRRCAVKCFPSSPLPPTLVSVDLTDSPVSWLPPSLAQLQQLRCTNCPISNLPAEIVGDGNGARILKHLRELQSSDSKRSQWTSSSLVRPRRMRVLVLGDCNVGKTRMAGASFPLRAAVEVRTISGSWKSCEAFTESPGVLGLGNDRLSLHDCKVEVQDQSTLRIRQRGTLKWVPVRFASPEMCTEWLGAVQRAKAHGTTDGIMPKHAGLSAPKFIRVCSTSVGEHQSESEQRKDLELSPWQEQHDATHSWFLGAIGSQGAEKLHYYLPSFRRSSPSVATAADQMSILHALQDGSVPLRPGSEAASPTLRAPVFEPRSPRLASEWTKSALLWEDQVFSGLFKLPTLHGLSSDVREEIHGANIHLIALDNEFTRFKSLRPYFVQHNHFTRSHDVPFEGLGLRVPIEIQRTVKDVSSKTKPLKIIVGIDSHEVMRPKNTIKFGSQIEAPNYLDPNRGPLEEFVKLSIQVERKANRKHPEHQNSIGGGGAR
eukprot:TRINITY_DN2176_c0_g1_i7.p1 TRINITY_DN2176_c0_g1~~TRINITY_DN2176_c0_g1_i7.p1  ORF type:complete len:2066 (+),score=383.64 TRINITY_DN2176_c0_g1_i7:301-6498(+)